MTPSQTEPASRDELLAAFLERYWTDVGERGAPRPLAAYLRLWPEHERTIAGEYFATRDGRPLEGAGSDEPAPAARKGTRLGPYRLVQELGRGGQGVVWLAEDTRLRRPVALKVLTRLGVKVHEAIARFQREAEIGARLDHPGICGIHDSGVEGGAAWIAMPYLEGETLACRIQGLQGRRDAGGAAAVMDRARQRGIVALFESVARALHAAHEAGVLHRDLKPGNIMITREDRPVILDFGLARLEDPDAPSLSLTGDMFGTPAYLSPEQLTARRIRLDRRSDVWSLGVALYEALALTRPFAALTREGLYQAILTREPESLRRRNPSVSRDLEVVVATALQKDRDRRYQTAAALADDLAAVLDRHPIAARPVGPVGRLVRWSRREPAKAALLAVLLVALPAIATLFTSHVANRPRVRQQEAAELHARRDELLSAGSFELGEGDPARAVQRFEAALALPGGSPEAVGGIVLARLRLEQPDEALRTLSERGAPLSGRRAAVVLRSLALAGTGRAAEAGRLLAAAPDPQDALDWYLEGQRLMTEGESGHPDAFRGALEAFSRAVFLSTAPRALYFEERAHAAGHAHDATRALESAAALEAHWPRSARAAFWRGFALDAAGRPEESIAAYREAIRLGPGDAWAHVNLGIALQGLGRTDEAVAAYRESLRIGGARPAAHLGLARLFQAQGLPDLAIAECREALRLRPDDTQTYQVLGLALTDRGRLDEAIAAHWRAVRLAPRDFHAYNNLGRVLGLSGSCQEAVAALREAVRLDPADGLGHGNLALALHQHGRRDEAIAAYRTSVRLRPDHAPSRRGLADFLQEAGLIDEAIVHLREAVRLVPRDAGSWSWLSEVLEERGLLDEAIAARREAIRLEPGQVRGWRLGRLLESQSRLDEAIAAYREAVRLDPEDALGWCSLGVALQDVGRFVEARDALRRGHALGSARPDWAQPSERLVRTVEPLAEEEERVGALLDRGGEPASASARAKAARVLLLRDRPAEAARWFARAFEEDAALAEQRKSGWRSCAAVAAARAGLGQGADARALGGGERAGFRERARAWLEAELESADRRSEELRRQLRRWLVEPAFAGVREDAGLAALPEPERAAWTALWTRVRKIVAAAPR